MICPVCSSAVPDVGTPEPMTYCSESCARKAIVNAHEQLARVIVDDPEVS